MTPPTWDEIWAKRTLDRGAASQLAALMAADGLDTGFGSVGEEHWRACVARVAQELRLAPGDSVLEVGCGAGAFLLPLAEQGHPVGGIDRSAALVGFAQEAMPQGWFAVGDAAALDAADVAGAWDAVVSFGVLMYFPGEEYAAGVIEAMARRARRVVALLDVPDRATEAEAIAHRIATVGGEDAYRERYAGLDHLYYDREWVAERLRATGLEGVRVESQWLAGYENARWRFNAWGFVPGSGAGA